MVYPPLRVPSTVDDEHIRVVVFNLFGLQQEIVERIEEMDGHKMVHLDQTVEGITIHDYIRFMHFLPDIELLSRTRRIEEEPVKRTIWNRVFCR
jgi:hypothetical protein